MAEYQYLTDADRQRIIAEETAALPTVESVVRALEEADFRARVRAGLGIGATVNVLDPGTVDEETGIRTGKVYGEPIPAPPPDDLDPVAIAESPDYLKAVAYEAAAAAIHDVLKVPKPVEADPIDVPAEGVIVDG